MVGGDASQLFIVGLGNPGKKYAMTRHNMGYLVVEGLARVLGGTLKEESKLQCRACRGTYKGVTVHLAQPTTYMNDSGIAVRKYVDYYKLTPAQVVAVVDDIAIPFGQMRLKGEGGTGGHNGLKSLRQHLGTNDYARLRVGVGDREHGELTDHVLGPFTAAEADQLPAVLDKAITALLRMTTDDLDDVMQDVNVKNLSTARNAGQEKLNEQG